MRTECEVSTTCGSGWVGFRNSLSLLLIWTLICGLAVPRVDAAGNWLIELSNALLSTPNTEQSDTPTDAVISRTVPHSTADASRQTCECSKPNLFPSAHKPQ